MAQHLTAVERHVMLADTYEAGRARLAALELPVPPAAVQHPDGLRVLCHIVTPSSGSRALRGLERATLHRAYAQPHPPWPEQLLLEVAREVALGRWAWADGEEVVW